MVDLKYKCLPFCLKSYHTSVTIFINSLHALGKSFSVLITSIFKKPEEEAFVINGQKEQATWVLNEPHKKVSYVA